MIKAADSSEMLLPTHKTTWCHNPDDGNCDTECWENLKSPTDMNKRSLSLIRLLIKC